MTYDPHGLEMSDMSDMSLDEADLELSSISRLSTSLHTEVTVSDRK